MVGAHVGTSLVAFGAGVMVGDNVGAAVGAPLAAGHRSIWGFSRPTIVVRPILSPTFKGRKSPQILLNTIIHVLTMNSSAALMPIIDICKARGIVSGVRDAAPSGVPATDV